MIRVLCIAYFIVHVRNGHISTPGLKSDVRIFQKIKYAYNTCAKHAHYATVGNP